MSCAILSSALYPFLKIKRFCMSVCVGFVFNSEIHQLWKLIDLDVNSPSRKKYTNWSSCQNCSALLSKINFQCFSFTTFAKGWGRIGKHYSFRFEWFGLSLFTIKKARFICYSFLSSIFLPLTALQAQDGPLFLFVVFFFFFCFQINISYVRLEVAVSWS